MLFARWQCGLGLAAAAVICGNAAAGPFGSSSNMVVIRCTDDGNAERVYLDEFDVSGAAPILVQTFTLPSSGPDAITLPNAVLGSHDRHLHLSADGHSLMFAAYH